MGRLLSTIFDALIISSAIAGIRRGTGIAIGQMVTQKISNVYARKGAELFFKSGEFVLDKTIQLLKNVKASSHMKNAQNFAEKITKKEKSDTKKPGDE
jgi:hypothetical protein